MDPRRLYILSLHSERTISSFLVDFISSCESSVGLHSIPSATTLAKVNQIDRLFTYVRHVLATPHRCIPLSSNKDPCVSMGDEPDERYPKIRTRMHIYPVMTVQKKRWNKTYRKSTAHGSHPPATPGGQSKSWGNAAPILRTRNLVRKDTRCVSEVWTVEGNTFESI